MLCSSVIYKSDLHVDTFIYLCGFCVWVNKKKKILWFSYEQKKVCFYEKINRGNIHKKNSIDIEKLELAAEGFLIVQNNVGSADFYWKGF